jgi:hypothetical protein
MVKYARGSRRSRRGDEHNERTLGLPQPMARDQRDMNMFGRSGSLRVTSMQKH